MKSKVQKRHLKACAFSGMKFTEASVDRALCCCDPTGEKKQAFEAGMEQYRRRTVLYQDQVWYPKEGDPVRLDEMSLRWKRNLLAFLERRASALHVSEVSSLLLGPRPGGDAATDAFDSMVSEIIETRPTTWLYQQPFVVRLEQLIREGNDGPVDRFNAVMANQCIRQDCTQPKAEDSQDCAEHLAEVIYG